MLHKNKSRPLSKSTKAKALSTRYTCCSCLRRYHSLERDLANGTNRRKKTTLMRATLRTSVLLSVVAASFPARSTFGVYASLPAARVRSPPPPFAVLPDVDAFSVDCVVFSPPPPLPPLSQVRPSRPVLKHFTQLSTHTCSALHFYHRLLTKNPTTELDSIRSGASSPEQQQTRQKKQGESRRCGACREVAPTSWRAY
jgi:hypothetical protein